MNDDASLDLEHLIPFLRDYVRTVRHELTERWKSWPLDLAKREMHEVIGALLARQVTLATQMADAPMTWNGHVAPMILRTMVENYIMLAYIFKSPLDRSRMFILHGLGQAKLIMEHRKAQLAADGKDPDDDPVVKATEAWLDSQRFTFLTEVNLGSWSGADVRKMAEEADCLDIYNYAYTPFSQATHSMWHHLSIYNLVTCPNPLHRYHKLPVDRRPQLDVYWMINAAKYADKSFWLFDKEVKSDAKPPSAYQALIQELERLHAGTGEDIEPIAQTDQPESKNT